MKYSEAIKTVAKARNSNRGYRLPGREGRTRLVQRSEGVAIRYTNTDVVTIYPDDSIKLDSGGWETKTTRDRMDYAETVRVFTEGGTMYVCQNGRYPWSALWTGNVNRKDWPALVWEFKDGMIFNAKGTRCLNAVQLGARSWKPRDWARHVRDERNRRARERRQARKAAAERDAKWNAEHAARAERRAVAEQAEATDHLSQFKGIESTGLAWPTLIRGEK